MFVKVDKLHDNIPFLVLLQSMGITKQKIFQILYKTLKVKKKSKVKKPKTSTKKALILLNELITENEPNFMRFHLNYIKFVTFKFEINLNSKVKVKNFKHITLFKIYSECSTT